jgi:hypothetical protein
MKKILPIAAAIIVIGLGSFFGGMKYGQSANLQTNTMRGNFQNQSGNGAQEGQTSFGANTGEGRMRGGNFISDNLANGEIIGSDDKSVTIKLPNGGSKIVFFSASTTISKMVEASTSDLVSGINITATGKQNTDGSITATTIQIRPAQPQKPQESQQQAQ